MSHIPPFWLDVIHVIQTISGLSNRDFYNLVGNYLHVVSGSLENENAIQSRGYSQEQLEQIKKQKMDKFNTVKAVGLEFTIPLENFKYDLIDYVLFLFQNYERGILPFPGSLSEQPAQIIEIFNVLSALRIEQQEKNRKKQEANERRQRKNQSRNNR